MLLGATSRCSSAQINYDPGQKFLWGIVLILLVRPATWKVKRLQRGGFQFENISIAMGKIKLFGITVKRTNNFYAVFY